MIKPELTVSWEGRKPEPEEISEFLNKAHIRLERSLVKLAFSILKDWHAGEDVVADSFLVLHDNILTGHEFICVSAWLRRTVMNKAVSYVRENVAREKAHAGLSVISNSVRDNAVDHRHQLQRFMDKELLNLSEQQQRAIKLVGNEKMTFEEASLHMECAAQTVKNHYYMAHFALRKRAEVLFAKYATST